MAKVLFVINVPYEKSIKKSNSGDEIDGADKNQNNQKNSATDTPDNELADPSLRTLRSDSKDVDTLDPGFDFGEDNSRPGKDFFIHPLSEMDTGQEPAKKAFFPDQNGKIAVSETAPIPAKIEKTDKLPTLKTIDESSSNKDTEMGSKKKADKLPALKTIDEIKSSSNKDTETGSKKKTDKLPALKTIDETKSSSNKDTETGSKKKTDKLPALKTIDETKSSSNKDTETGSKKKSNDVNAEIDEADGKKKVQLRKDSIISIGKKVEHVEEPGIEYISFVSDGLTVLERVKATLEALDIPAVNWNRTQDNIHVGTFIAGDGVRCEEILDKLTYLDIGVIPGSSISVFPASISIASVTREDQAEKLKLELEKEDKLAEKVSEFKKSIKSRLVVAQVVDSVKSDAMFTFDYLMLVILASLVAIMGLLESSSVSLVASMLISPLMGPIIAFVFGAVIRNRELLTVGILSESKGLGLCILVGFISGLIPAGLESAGLPWRSTENWPTVEMSARGSFRSIPVGVLIALPSGAGVALSILGGKVGSLVGVAISASLLPPAVNAGLLWANALIVSIIPPKLEPLNIMNTSANGCPQLFKNFHGPIYSCNMAVESVVLGVLSLLLTIVNILCIILMGVIVLKIKEVAPIRLGQDAEKDFFAKDLKVARESYETTKGPNSAILGKKFLQEYKKFKQDIGVEDSKNTDNELNEILEDVEDGEDVKEILDKLPHRPKRWSSYVEDDKKVAGNPYHTFHGPTNKPYSPDLAMGVRKRGSAYVTISPSRMEDDDKHASTYLTTHFYPTNDGLHSPRTSHRSPGRFFTKMTQEKNRFHVAKVMEDGHNVPKVSVTPSSPSKVDIMPSIKECVPLLDMASNEV